MQSDTTQLLDTNVWLALALHEHPGHLTAQTWFMDQKTKRLRLSDSVPGTKSIPQPIDMPAWRALDW